MAQTKHTLLGWKLDSWWFSVNKTEFWHHETDKERWAEEQWIGGCIWRGRVRLQVGCSEATNKMGGIRTESVVAEDCVWE